jgi:hypothetical protein
MVDIIPPLKVIVMLPWSNPRTLGVKVMFSVQLPPGAKGTKQSSISA